MRGGTERQPPVAGLARDWHDWWLPFLTTLFVQPMLLLGMLWSSGVWSLLGLRPGGGEVSLGLLGLSDQR